MLRGCFLWHGVGPLVKIVGNMNAIYYVCKISESVVLPYAEEEIPLRCFGLACTITGPQSNRTSLDRRKERRTTS